MDSAMRSGANRNSFLRRRSQRVSLTAGPILGSCRSSASRPGLTEIPAPWAASRASSRSRYQRIASGAANSPCSTGLCCDQGLPTVSSGYRPALAAASIASHSRAISAARSLSAIAAKSADTVIRSSCQPRGRLHRRDRRCSRRVGLDTVGGARRAGRPGPRRGAMRSRRLRSMGRSRAGRVTATGVARPRCWLPPRPGWQPACWPRADIAGARPGPAATCWPTVTPARGTASRLERGQHHPGLDGHPGQPQRDVLPSAPCSDQPARAAAGSSAAARTATPR